MLRAVLSDAYGQYVCVRVILEPANAPESATGIEQHGGRFRVFALQADTQLWSYERLRLMKNDGTPSGGWVKLERTLPRDWRGVKVARHDADLDPALARRIAALWTAMLYETRYIGPGEDHGVVVGTTFHFSGLGETQFLAGSTESPPPGSKTAMLTDIAAAMAAYANAPDGETLAELESRVAALEVRLKEAGK